MWTCKRCHTENQEHHNTCSKCYGERPYPFRWSRFLCATLALSSITIPVMVLSAYYLNILLLLGMTPICMFLAAFLMEYCKPKYSSVIAIVISVLLGFLALIILDDYFLRRELEAYHPDTICYIILSLSILGFILYIRRTMKEDDIKRQKLFDEMEIERKRRERDEQKKYGKPTRTIEPYGRDRFLPSARIFPDSEVIEINGRKIKFGDIVSYHISEDVTSELHMSKPSMWRRGIAGGLLFGRTGAFIGAATAEQYLQTEVVYTIRISLKNGLARVVHTEDIGFAEDLCSALDSILSQNVG